MNTSFYPSSPGAPSARPPGRRVLHLVDFIYLAPKAQTVALIGDFNKWDPKAHPMTRRPDGGWSIRMELPHGHHQYQFLVDGKPTLDPNAMGTVRNENNEAVSLIAIS